MNTKDYTDILRGATNNMNECPYVTRKQHEDQIAKIKNILTLQTIILSLLTLLVIYLRLTMTT